MNNKRKHIGLMLVAILFAVSVSFGIGFASGVSSVSPVTKESKSNRQHKSETTQTAHKTHAKASQHKTSLFDHIKNGVNNIANAYFYGDNKGAREDAKIAKTYEHKADKLQKQKYITLAQFKAFVHDLNTHYTPWKESFKLARRFDQTHVVDDADGHEYMLHTWFNDRTLYFRYKIKAISNGKTAEVNPIWMKEHKADEKDKKE